MLQIAFVVISAICVVELGEVHGQSSVTTALGRVYGVSGGSGGGIIVLSINDRAFPITFNYTDEQMRSVPQLFTRGCIVEVNYNTRLDRHGLVTREITSIERLPADTSIVCSQSDRINSLLRELFLQPREQLLANRRVRETCDLMIIRSILTIRKVFPVETSWDSDSWIITCCKADEVVVITRPDLSRNGTSLSVKIKVTGDLPRIVAVREVPPSEYLRALGEDY